MKKWYDEEYEWEIEVTGFLRGDHTEGYCRNGEEVGDKYTCTYGCPVNSDGQGYLLQSNAGHVPNHGGGQKRRRFGKHRRQQQIQQGCGMSGWLRDVSNDGEETWK